MDNQHRKIQGYRELNQEEVDLMNAAKELGARVGQFIDEMDQGISVQEGKVVLDERAKAIARTEIQTGFMWLIRSIAKPNTFC